MDQESCSRLLSTTMRSPSGAMTVRLLPVLLAICSLVIDINTPHGMLDGLLYVSAVLVCVWLPATNLAFYTALGLMPLMILGFALSPRGVSVETAVANLCVAMVIVWLAAFAVSRAARATREREDELRRQLEAAERAAGEERAALSDWLHNVITPELQILDWRVNYLPMRAPRHADLRGETLILHRVIRRVSQSARAKEARLRCRDAAASSV